MKQHDGETFNEFHTRLQMSREISREKSNLKLHSVLQIKSFVVDSFRNSGTSLDQLDDFYSRLQEFSMIQNAKPAKSKEQMVKRLPNTQSEKRWLQTEATACDPTIKGTSQSTTAV